MKKIRFSREGLDMWQDYTKDNRPPHAGKWLITLKDKEGTQKFMNYNGTMFTPGHLDRHVHSFMILSNPVTDVFKNSEK